MSEYTAPEEQTSLQTEFPLPTDEVSFDRNQAEQWVNEEPDPQFKQLKQKIIDSIQIVPHTEFHSAAQECLKKAVQSIGEKDFVILWDGKPHSSKRWLYEQFKSEINIDNCQAQYFGMYDKMDNYQEFEGYQGDTFLIFDDAIYSGEQVVNKGIKLIIEMYKRYVVTTGDSNANRAPKIVIAAPYVTNFFINNPLIQEAINLGVIELHYEYIMPCLGEVIGEKGAQLLANRDNELDLPEQALQRGVLDPNDNKIVLTATLTAFQHRVADAHSFVEPIAKRLNIHAAIPYKRENTQYYKNEENEFNKYKNRILQRKKVPDIRV